MDSASSIVILEEENTWFWGELDDDQMCPQCGTPWLFHQTIVRGCRSKPMKRFTKLLAAPPQGEAGE